MNVNPESGASLTVHSAQRAFPRSVACNGDVVKRLRKRLGLTQAQLAKRSGFSERLVRKAESSAPISMKTVRALATALSDDDRHVDANLLLCSPLESAKTAISEICRNGRLEDSSTQIAPQTIETIRQIDSQFSPPNYFSNDDGVVAFTNGAPGQWVFVKFSFSDGNLIRIDSYTSQSRP